MKHRERVLMSLNHEEPDRCPMQVSFTPEFADRLRRELHLGGDKVHNPHGGGNTYELERALGEDMLLSGSKHHNPHGGGNTYELERALGEDMLLSGSKHHNPHGGGNTYELERALGEDMLLSGSKHHNPHGGGNTYELERALGEDMLLTSVGWANSYYQEEREYVDEWGILWKSQEYTTPYGTGRYTEIAQNPLADDGAIDRYRGPDPDRPELYEEAAWVIREFKDEYWIVGVTVTTIFECAWALRGYERLLSDFVLNPDLADRILEIPYRYHLAAAKKLVEMGVDMIWIGDDIGAQSSLLISPKHWRRFLKPRMANFIAELKGINPQVKVAYHSDGNILPVIPELVEIGLDVLNPVQPACMDPARLKKEFGERLCFWGSIDEQHTLPFGTPEDVRAEVIHRLKTLGKGGGLILGPTHHVQLDTPMENFWAMIHTITNTPYRMLNGNQETGNDPASRTRGGGLHPDDLSGDQ